MSNGVSVTEIALALRRQSDLSVLFSMNGQFEWCCRCKFTIDLSHKKSKQIKKTSEQISNLRAQVYKNLLSKKPMWKRVKTALEAFKKISFLYFKLLSVQVSPTARSSKDGSLCRLSDSFATVPIHLSDDDSEGYHAVANFIDKPSTEAYVRSSEFAAFLERGSYNEDVGAFNPPYDDFGQWWSDSDPYWGENDIMSPEEKWERSGRRRSDWWFSSEDKKNFKGNSAGRLKEYYKDANGSYSLRNFVISEHGRYGEMTLDLATSEIWKLGDVRPDNYNFYLGESLISADQLREAFFLAEQQAEEYLDEG